MAEEAYECTVSGVLAGQFVQNIVHTAIDNTFNIPSFQVASEIAAQLAAAGEFVEKFTDCLPTDYIATSVRVRRVSAGGGPTAIVLQATMSQAAGQRTGQISSAQVSPLVILIPTVNQNRTGRIFLPGVSEDDIDQMVLVGALVTAMQALVTYMLAGTSIPTGTVVYGVFRRALLLTDPLAAGYVSPLIGTQRRRLRPV
jgi:hypothetical protein